MWCQISPRSSRVSGGGLAGVRAAGGPARAGNSRRRHRRPSRSGCTCTTRPNTARRISRPSRFAASRSTSTTDISTTNSSIFSTTPTSRRWSSTRRLAIGCAGCATAGSRLRLLVEVDDGAAPTADPCRRCCPLRAIAGRPTAPAPSDWSPHGEELYIFYTGGTTGMPKGVMYSLKDSPWFLRVISADDRVGPAREDPDRDPRHGTADVSRREPPRRHVGYHP